MNWEDTVNINEVKEIRAKTTVFFGIGAIEKIDFIAETFAKDNIDKVLVITGKSSYKRTGAWDYVEKALNKHNIKFAIYSKVTPNPTVIQVDEATQMGKELGAKAVIAIGGGSPIDASKSVAILLANPQYDARALCEYKFAPEKATPIVAINLTHGTGTEADRFAVVSIPEKEFKPAIAYDCIYPTYSIDDPALMTQLPERQTLFVSIDAVNHAIEAATSKIASPITILYSKEAIRLVVKYLPMVMKNHEDLRARYFLLYASLIAGISFDNGLLHFTHALEHPLSAVKPDLTHGLGLAMLLPAVIKQIYTANPLVMQEILSPVIEGLDGSSHDAQKAACEIEQWLFNLGATEKLLDEGFSEADVDKLTKLVEETPSLGLLLSMAPVPSGADVVKEIYHDSLRPMQKTCS